MSLSAGFTNEEIRSFVYEYEAVPHGRKAVWLVGRPFTQTQIYRWRAAVFDGDLDRGRVPREGGGMNHTASHQRRRAGGAAFRDQQAAQIEQLRARIHELEGVNDALGKAIGLLHRQNAQEPGPAPTTTGPETSSAPRTPSSER